MSQDMIKGQFDASVARSLLKARGEGLWGMPLSYEPVSWGHLSALGI